MKRALLIGAIFLLALLIGSEVLQAQGGYDLPWWTVDGGGTTTLSAGGYTLGGAAGQPDAGELSNGNYTLGGGFWGGGAVVEAGPEVYLPVIMR